MITKAFIIITFLFYIYVVYAAPALKLPKGFIQCKRSDAEFYKCTTRAANAAIPPLVKGVAKFGLPPIDPLRINSLYVDQGTGPVTIKLNFTDLDITGIGSCKISDVTVNVDQPVIKLKMEATKPIVLDGQYAINGKVLILPIVGSGKSKFTLSGFKAIVTTTGENYMKDGQVHWKIKPIDFQFDVSKLHFRLDNLFNGDKQLGENMNEFMNENWRDILNELKPAFQGAFSEAFREITQRFYDAVPINQIFPK